MVGHVQPGTHGKFVIFVCTLIDVLTSKLLSSKKEIICWASKRGPILEANVPEGAKKVRTEEVLQIPVSSSGGWEGAKGAPD